MAIFNKQESQAQKSRDRVGTPSRNGAVDGAISIIGPGMVMTGDVVTEGIVRVEGGVVGTIRAAKAVILGKTGRVDGDIFTEDAVIGGTVTGTIIANNRVELQSTCVVDGEIRTKPQCLKLEEGARFAGEVKVVESENPLTVLEVDGGQSDRTVQATGSTPARGGQGSASVSGTSVDADARVA